MMKRVKEKLKRTKIRDSWKKTVTNPINGWRYALNHLINTFDLDVDNYKIEGKVWYIDGYHVTSDKERSEIIETLKPKVRRAMVEYIQRLRAYEKEAAIEEDREEESIEDLLNSELESLRIEDKWTYYALKKLLGKKYKKCFLHDTRSLPTKLMQSFNPFFAGNKRVLPQAKFEKRMVRTTKTGKCKITYSGNIPRAIDALTLYALMNLKDEERNHYDEWYDPSLGDNNRLNTTLLNILKELRISNPYDKKAKIALKNSLTRLAGCVMTMEGYADIEFSIGGLISRAVGKLDGRVKVEFNEDFIKLFRGGYLGIDEDILYSLKSEKDINLYLWILSQKEFSITGKLGFVRPMTIEEVYDRANLNGLGVPKLMAHKRSDLKQILNHFKSLRVISGYSLKGDKVTLKN